MDYCEGGDLFKRINSQKGVLFSETQILDWFVQICLALKHIHDRKILHRDIKSQNIFLTKDGTVQLGDFGIARVLNSTVELARTCIGTPYYLSPEICENKPYNNKSDIWALGCVLYEMCTLKHAFEAGNMKNLVLKIIRGSYPPVSVHYSHELRSLLGQLFKRNPRERPSVSIILDKPFLSSRIERFLTPQIIAQEFHHTFIHKQPKAGGGQGQPEHTSTCNFTISQAPCSRCHSTRSSPEDHQTSLQIRSAFSRKKVPDAARKAVDKKPAVKQKQINYSLLCPVGMAKAPSMSACVHVCVKKRVRLFCLSEPPCCVCRSGPSPSSPTEESESSGGRRKKHEEGMRKKRMELIEKERKQREQLFLLKAEQMKKYEKEKIDRINQAREQGWKHVLSSSGGSSPERKCFVGGVKRALPISPCHVPSSAAGHAPSAVQNKSPYDHYHAALDQTAKPKSKDVSRDGSSASSVVGVPPAAGPVLPIDKVNRVLLKQELLRLQHDSKQVHINRHRGHVPAERAFQVEEFLQRKREALINKVRAEGQLGLRQNLAAILGSRTGSVRCRRPRANKEEEEYLARLRQIRLQNFNERQQIKARLRGEKYDSDGSDSQESSEGAELRRKKIEAVKAQANARAAVLKEQLEKKRREAHEREKKAWEVYLAGRGKKISPPASTTVETSSSSDAPPAESCDPQPALPSSSPSTPAISMTAALHNVGAQMASLKETATQPEGTPASQSEKKQILRRLNDNLKAQTLVEEGGATLTAESSSLSHQPVIEERPPSNGDRRKWDAAQVPELHVKSTFTETCVTTASTLTESAEERPSSGGDRKKWEAGVPLVLPAAQTLGQTCVTTINDTVSEVSELSVLQDGSPRKVWGVNPDTQVLKVLQEAELQPLTQKLENASIWEGDLSINVSPNKSAAVEVIRTPQDALTLDPDPAVSVQSPDVQEESPDSADVESLVLEEQPKPFEAPPASVQPAWEQDVPLPLPADGNTTLSNSCDAEKPVDKPPAVAETVQSEEPLFLKLCSPAHLSPLRSKHHDSLLIGLSTGMFDANNPKMLRTCSLPDLSRFSSSQQDAETNSNANVAPENNLEIEDLEETAKDDDHSEPEDAYEDEDLRDIRASMERLLQEEGDLMGCPTEMGAGDFNGNPPEVQQHQELFQRLAAEMEQNNLMAVDDDDDEDGDGEEEEDEEEEEGSNGSPGDDEEVGLLLSNGVGGRSHGNDVQLNEEWQSERVPPLENLQVPL
ncbi:hypothetical protein WMY93_010604 [Mugilogobius chulae]|uniref:non-specific serine/threonine protein kinase n=1 Tax=Mugilogobius chulae TaxID=88201 RepID=A0AAW0P7U3_9GOBI